MTRRSVSQIAPFQNAKLQTKLFYVTVHSELVGDIYIPKQNQDNRALPNAMLCKTNPEGKCGRSKNIRLENKVVEFFFEVTHWSLRPWLALAACGSTFWGVPPVGLIVEDIVEVVGDARPDTPDVDDPVARRDRHLTWSLDGTAATAVAAGVTADDEASATSPSRSSSPPSSSRNRTPLGRA